MGCDIHLYQEKKVGGKWVAADKWEHGKYDELSVYDRLYAGRNYRLFAVLAGVRNGVGFAGIRTGDPVIPIALPRGVAVDSCVEYQKEVLSWGVDGHSHSWLTLADLEGYPWKSARVRGVVPLRPYRAWKASGDANPSEWSGDVSGPKIEIISEDLAAALMSGFDSDRIYVEASWLPSLRKDCTEFLDAVMPRLRELEGECGPGNARLVFFFDS